MRFPEQLKLIEVHFGDCLELNPLEWEALGSVSETASLMEVTKDFLGFSLVWLS